jgi:hypothetical protein
MIGQTLMIRKTTTTNEKKKGPIGLRLYKKSSCRDPHDRRTSNYELV